MLPGPLGDARLKERAEKEDERQARAFHSLDDAHGVEAHAVQRLRRGLVVVPQDAKGCQCADDAGEGDRMDAALDARGRVSRQLLRGTRGRG